MPVYIIDGKPYGLSATQIHRILEQGITTFDRLLEAYTEGELDDVFEENEAYIEVGQALLAYTNKHVGPNKAPRLLHLLEEAREFGFTNEMIARLHSGDIFTIVQAVQAVSLNNSKMIEKLFPIPVERLKVLSAINKAGEALSRQLTSASAELKAKDRANLCYWHCQLGPSLN